MEAHWGPHLVAEGLGAVDVTGGRGVIIILHARTRVKGCTGTASPDNSTLQQSAQPDGDQHQCAEQQTGPDGTATAIAVPAQLPEKRGPAH